MKKKRGLLFLMALILGGFLGMFAGMFKAYTEKLWNHFRCQNRDSMDIIYLFTVRFH